MEDLAASRFFDQCDRDFTERTITRVVARSNQRAQLDSERQEVRALSIHAFTNQPIRLVRILRYVACMGFKMESRTQEWFDLAMERKLHENLDAG